MRLTLAHIFADAGTVQIVDEINCMGITVNIWNISFVGKATIGFWLSRDISTAGVLCNFSKFRSFLGSLFAWSFPA